MRRKNGIVIRINKATKDAVHIEREAFDTRMKLSIDFRKDWLESYVDTKSEMLDKNLAKLARLVGFHLVAMQEEETPDFHGTGHMLGSAFKEIIKRRNKEDKFIRGKHIFTDGKCSTLFSMIINPQYPIGSLDIRMMGGAEYAMDRNLEDFLVGFSTSAGIHANIILEKVDDKKHEWDSVFESMSGSLIRLMSQR
ncbi:MAG: hypothetical protein GXO64_02365 [Candidatus Micrarchaeota archaeon]|nr:hypothetical protein [Candidatus Micrarchaeota archaeon]